MLSKCLDKSQVKTQSHMNTKFSDFQCKSNFHSNPFNHDSDYCAVSVAKTISTYREHLIIQTMGNHLLIE